MSEFRERWAAWLRRVANRIDPPIYPYGEWDRKACCLVIKIPGAAGYSPMTLADIDFSRGITADMISEERPRGH